VFFVSILSCCCLTKTAIGLILKIKYTELKYIATLSKEHLTITLSKPQIPLKAVPKQNFAQPKQIRISSSHQAHMVASLGSEAGVLLI